MGFAARILGRDSSLPPRNGGRAGGADDIDAELAFHLEQRERELVAMGMTPEAAHAEALRRFGDLEQVRAECRRIQTGGFLMLQRITLVVLVLVVAVLSYFSYQGLVSQHASRQELEALRAEIQALTARTPAPGNSSAKPDGANPALESWKEERINQLKELTDVKQLAGLGYIGSRGQFMANIANTVFLDSRKPQYKDEAVTDAQWLAGFQEDGANADPQAAESALALRATRLARGCTPGRGLEVLSTLWNELTPAACVAVLDAFVNGVDETTARRAIFLATMDDDATVAQRGFERLRELCLVRFDASTREAYLAWHATNESLGLSEITDREASRLIQELSGFAEWNPICELYSSLVIHRSLPAANALPDELRAAGALKLVKRWAASDDPRARLAAMRWLGQLEADEVTARMLLMPMLADPRPRHPEFFAAACDAMRNMNGEWAWEPLLGELGRLLRAPELDRPALDQLAEVIGQQQPEHLLPTLVAWIVKLDSPAVTESLGRNAITRFTNVEYDPIQDGAWWLNWWTIHGEEYDHDGAGPLGLPKLD